MNNSNVNTLLKTLIDIPSNTGSEQKLGAFLAEYLEKIGLKVQTIAVGSGRQNVLATSGQPLVMLQAHMDVVPPHIPAREDAATIYGRGACDTKASIAAMICAAELALAGGVSDFGLLFTVGEEVDFAGVQAVQKTLSTDKLFFIVGEPTQLQVVNAHFGILRLDIVCTGLAAHSSQPQLGKNAIDALLAVLADTVDTLSIAPGTLMSKVLISGGTAENIIPDRAIATLSFRIAPTDTQDYVAILREKLKNRAHIENILLLGPVASEVPKQLAFLGEGQTVKYCTELSFLKNGIVFGPGDIQNAHKQTEKIEKKQLAKAVKLYQKIVQLY